MKKICSKCKKEKELKYFSFSNKKKGILQSYCKECANANRIEYYKKNKEREDNRNREWEIKQKKCFEEYKKNLFCESCGENRWWLLEFHHDNGDKSFDIGSKNGEVSFNRLLEEIKKCNVLCANCHRDLHFKRKRGEFA